MCDSCGCGRPAHSHSHDEQDHTHTHGDDRHDHDHGGGHGHDHDHESTTRTVALEQKLLAKNDDMAAGNRTWLRERGIVAVNLISAPGTGKTRLLEATLDAFRDTLPCAVITGDQKTDNDAKRLAGKGAPVRQIETVSACHLDAHRVHHLLPEVVTQDTRLLFIENVGNLVCPAAFDLGENFKVALMSVTEGEDKPVKYPSLFTQTPVAVVTKTDLLPHVDFDIKLCRANLQRMHPGIFVFEVSAQTGDGMQAWLDYLKRLAG